MAGLLTAAQGAHTLLVGKGEPSIDNWTFRLFYKVSLAVMQKCQDQCLAGRAVPLHNQLKP